MKINFAFLSIIVLLFGCQNGVEKPEKFIDQDEMIEILYDFALLEGVRSDYSLNQTSLNPEEFIYKKYKIDSLQFAQNNAYYAADVQQYKEMFQKISEKIDKQKTEKDSLLKGKNPKKLERKGEPVVK